MSDLECCHNLISQAHPNPEEDVEHATSHAMLIARVMKDINSKVTMQRASFAQQHILGNGLKAFWQQRTTSVNYGVGPTASTELFFADICQEHDTTREEESHGSSDVPYQKTRQDCNRKQTAEWLTREDSASPMVALESIMLTAVIEAHYDNNNSSVLQWAAVCNWSLLQRDS